MKFGERIDTPTLHAFAEAARAAQRLPNFLRIVFSDGLIPAAVHDAEVGKTPRSSTKRLSAARASSSSWPVPPELSPSRRPRNCRVFELFMAGSTQSSTRRGLIDRGKATFQAPAIAIDTLAGRTLVAPRPCIRLGTGPPFCGRRGPGLSV